MQTSLKNTCRFCTKTYTALHKIIKNMKIFVDNCKYKALDYKKGKFYNKLFENLIFHLDEWILLYFIEMFLGVDDTHCSSCMSRAHSLPMDECCGCLMNKKKERKNVFSLRPNAEGTCFTKMRYVR